MSTEQLITCHSELITFGTEVLDKDQIVTFDQMKDSIGTLVSLWSNIEKALKEAISSLHSGESPKSVHGISRSINVWSLAIISDDPNRSLQTMLCRRLVTQLTEALTIRNLVCHGLTGISAKPHNDSPEACLRVQLGEDARTLTWSQLNTMFRWMVDCQYLINDLTKSAMRNDAKKAENNLLSWRNYP